MLKLQSMKIKDKLTLIIMLTCIGALLLAGSMFMLWEWSSLRRNMVQDLSTQAEMIADNCNVALAFNNSEDAEQILSSLRAKSSILLGCIRTKTGEPFASYYRDGFNNDVHLCEVREDGYSFGDGALTVFKTIALDGEKIGRVCLRSDLNPIYVTLRRNATIIIAVLVFCTLAAYLFASRLQRIISKPILSLTQIAKQISEKEDYSVRATKQSEDEIGVLIEAFNQMLEQIHQRDLQLVDANEKLEIKVQQRTAELTAEIDERKKAENALEVLNEDLETTVLELSRSNRELQDFAHAIAHDLKTPLRSIGTLSHWLSSDYADKFDQEGIEHIKLLTVRAERISELIDSILKYSEVGRTRQKMEKVDLNIFLTEIISAIDPPENIEITIENELPTIICEKVRMTQLFQNLLVNAIKYMDKPKGQIKIDCVEENGFWKFSIADNGPGIKERYFEKIFKIFQTLTPRDEVESTGIGLSMVKKILETYNGKIWVESQVGLGSTFFFTLPCSHNAIENNRAILGSGGTKNQA